MMTGASAASSAASRPAATRRVGALTLAAACLAADGQIAQIRHLAGAPAAAAATASFLTGFTAAMWIATAAVALALAAVIALTGPATAARQGRLARACPHRACPHRACPHRIRPPATRLHPSGLPQAAPPGSRDRRPAMPHTSLPASASQYRNPAHTAYDLLTAVSMTVGRGPAAHAIAGLALLSASDRVVNIGCGPGTAVRTAARQCASVTGVDPAPQMLRLGRWITARQHLANVTFTEGRAEALPLPDASATVAWALNSVHHWPDRAAGLAEAARVLAPGGRILLAERLVKPGARGHAAHGLTRDQAGQLTASLQAAGFTDLSCQSRQAGHRTLVIITGALPWTAR